MQKPGKSTCKKQLKGVVKKGSCFNLICETKLLEQDRVIKIQGLYLKMEGDRGMFRKILTGIITAAMLSSLLFAMPVTLIAGDSFFEEDFEGYAENGYPSTFECKYDGSGLANQKVITAERQGTETKVFRLQGKGSWSSEQLAALPESLPEILVISAYVRPVSGSWPGRIGLYNPVVGSWGTRVSAIIFEGGRIKTLQEGDDNNKIDLGPYTAGSWYYVQMKHDLNAKSYDIYIDGVKAASDIGMHPTASATHLNLTGGNIGTNEIYFDDILIAPVGYYIPGLTGGPVARHTDGEAEVKFSTSRVGECYYAVVDSGAPEPLIDTDGSGLPCSAGENALSLDSLTAGAKDIYIQVKELMGQVSEVLKLEIPAYIPPVPGILQFNASGYGTHEGANLYIGVERTGGTDGAVSVTYTAIEDSAKEGIHYNPPYSGTLYWADGDGDKKYIPYHLTDDSIYNGYLYYSYILSEPTGGATLGENSILPMQISDNDDPPVPAGLAAVAGDSKVTLTWDEVYSAYYILFCSTVSGDFTSENSVKIYDGETYTWTDLSNGTPYYFAIQAGHNIFYGALSDEVSATPAAPTYALGVLAGEGGAVNGAGSFAAGETVTITAIAGSGYRFSGWISDGGDIFADAHSAVTTMIMPANPVTVTATFAEEPPEIEPETSNGVEETAALPQTGGASAGIIYGLGTLFAAAGAALLRRKK